MRVITVIKLKSYMADICIFCIIIRKFGHKQESYSVISLLIKQMYKDKPLL